MTATRQLAFRELNIIRMPGLTGSIRLEDLGPGVVIVAGPNASGKTTSSRVMNYLLWPEAAEQDLAKFGYQLHHVSLRSKLVIGDEEWSAGYEDGRRRLMRGTANEGELPVPPREHQQRYNLSLSQLLTGDDRDFAAWIHREAMGGFDPDRAGKELIQKSGMPKRNLAEYKAWQKAAEKVRDITKRDQQLRRDQQRLDELIRQRKKASYKARQIRMFESVIDLRETESRLEEVALRLESYPESHAQYHVQLRKSIEEAAGTMTQLDTELNDLRNDLEGFREEQAAIGLPDGGVPQERLDRLAHLLRDIEDLATQAGRLDREIGAADAERVSILKQINNAGTGSKATAGSGSGSGEAAGVNADAETATEANVDAGTNGDQGIDTETGTDTVADLHADSVLKNGFHPEWVDRAADLVRREAEAENRRLAAESELALLDDAPGEEERDEAGEKKGDDKDGFAPSGGFGDMPGEKGADATGERKADATGEKAGNATAEKSGASAGDVRKGIDLLTEWLREVGGAQLRGIPPVRAAVMLLLAALAAGAMLIEPLAGLLVIIPLLWLGAEWIRLRKARLDAESGRIPTRFSESGLAAPKRWDIDSVKDRFLALTESYLPLRETERNRDRRKIIEKKRADAVSELDKIASARLQLANESGVAPEGVGLPELHFRLHHIHQYNETLTKLAGLREERNGCDDSRERLQKEFVALISEYDDSADAGTVSVSGSGSGSGTGTGTRDVISGPGSQRQKHADLFSQAAALSHRDLREQLDRLVSRNSRWRELQQQIQGAEDQIEKAEDRRQKEQERADNLYDTLGLQSGDYAGLLKLDEEHGAYQECIRQKQALEQKQESNLGNIRGHEGYEPAVEELTREQAEAEVASCRRAEDEVRELQDQITRIETLLKERIGKQELADALRLEDTARERLAGQFENYLSDAILSRTVDWLKKENQRRNYPEVFHRANELFRSFTENRYELEVIQAGPGFVAIDHVNNGDMYTLDRLSEGTRIQLLLAVRMAFVEQLESGVRVPFFADELLAVSDDARAGAIMDALLAISREGRQVFYFTAQGDEVEKWMQKAAATGDSELVQVRTLGRGELFPAGGGLGEGVGVGPGSGDTGEVGGGRDLVDAEGARDATDIGDTKGAPDMAGARDASRFRGAGKSPRWRFGYGSDVPSPKGKSHEKYGEVLGVPSADPMATGADRLHPWYLTEDTDLIYECLRNGLMTWRQIRMFLKHGGKLAATEEQIGKMKEAATLASKALELWREGRPRPLTPSALRDCNAITGAYTERADALAQKVHYDPVRFLAKVEQGALQRFREDKKAELRNWLDENGYLPEADPLSDEEVQVRLRALASGFRYLGQEEAERIVKRIMRTQESQID